MGQAMSVDEVLITVAVVLALLLVALRLRKQREITRAWAAASHGDLQRSEVRSDGSEPSVLQ